MKHGIGTMFPIDKDRGMILRRKRLLAALCFGLALAGPGAAHAQQATRDPSRVLAVGEAHAKAQAGEIVLVDIRTPEEWRETGVPASAHAITMHQDPRVFVRQLMTAMGGDRHRPLALICRTGNRSSSMQAALAKAGFTRVLDVAEGVAGSSYGKGWFRAGLPARSGSQASTPPAVSASAGAK